MPEGDTLHRVANRLRPALAGAALRRFEAPRLPGDRPAVGVAISDVEAVGKHLLVHFDDGLTLRTHLGMAGSWHLYREGERWRKPRHLLRALVGVDGWDAVCFSAPQVQTYRPDRPGGALGTDRDPTGHLGPDLCTGDVDLDAALARYRTADPSTTAAEALLDQNLASGIGNVYKSELLHRCRVDPFVALGEVPEAVRRELLVAANRLLLHNLTTTRRTTVAGPAGSVAVYGKARRPCPRCGTPIRMVRHGIQNRSTYWCPRCQPPGAVGSGVPSAAMAERTYRQHRFRRPPGATEVLLVRHGESEPAVPGRPFPLVDGHGDPALAPTGREQADRVADRLEHEQVDALYVTSLRRTAETAAPLAARTGLVPRVEADLREVHLGEWEGGLFRQKVAEGDPIVARLFAEERWDAIPGAEPHDRLVGRVRGAIGRIVAAHPDQRVVVVSHGGVIGQVLALAAGARSFAFTGCDNGSISHLVVSGDRWIIRRFNDTGHLADGFDLDPDPDLPQSDGVSA